MLNPNRATKVKIHASRAQFKGIIATKVTRSLRDPVGREIVPLGEQTHLRDKHDITKQKCQIMILKRRGRLVDNVSYLGQACNEFLNQGGTPLFG